MKILNLLAWGPGEPALLEHNGIRGMTALRILQQWLPPCKPISVQIVLERNLISGSNYLLPKKIKAFNFLPLQVDFGRKK